MSPSETSITSAAITVLDVAALCLLRSWADKKVITRRMLAGTVYVLRHHGFRVEGSLRQVPGGFQSDDLDEILSRWSAECLLGFDSNNGILVSRNHIVRDFFFDIVHEMIRKDSHRARNIIEDLDIDVYALLAT